jgi:biotin transport system permease protein
VTAALALYEPGSSVLHRAPAGPSFVVVLLFAAGTVALDDPLWLAGACVLVALGYVVARIRLRRVLGLLRMLALLAGLILLIQWWLIGPREAAVACLRIVAAVGAANLFTLVTKVDDLVGAIERALGPLRRFGVDPERVGVIVGLTVQAVGTLAGIAAQVREAGRARGAERSLTAFAVPFVVRTLRYADELGEALAARGWGDRHEHDER